METRTNTGYVAFLSVVAAIGGILFGYDTAVISGTITSVETQFALNAMQVGWYVGCALIGSIGGVAVAGILSDRFGRKLTMLLAAVLFTASGIGCAVCGDFTQLVIYRILGGIGIGVVSIVSPMYISEVAVARWRGTLVSLYQLAITIGFLGAYLVNFQILRAAETAIYDSPWMQQIMVTEMWRGMLGSNALPAVLFFVVIFFIPESPPLADPAQPHGGGARRTATHLPLVGGGRRRDRLDPQRRSRSAEVRMAGADVAGNAQGASDRRSDRHAGAVHGRERRALLRPHDLRGRGTFERRFALLAGARGRGEHADHRPGARHHRPRGPQTGWSIGACRA